MEIKNDIPPPRPPPVAITEPIERPPSPNTAEVVQDAVEHERKTESTDAVEVRLSVHCCMVMTRRSFSRWRLFFKIVKTLKNRQQGSYDNPKAYTDCEPNPNSNPSNA